MEGQAHVSVRGETLEGLLFLLPLLLLLLCVCVRACVRARVLTAESKCRVTDRDIRVQYGSAGWGTAPNRPLG